MKKFLFGCSIALTGLTMPLAADYCCPYPCEPEPCCGDFNGFYFGGNVGVYSNTAHRNDYDGFFTGGSRSTTSTNVTAGLQLGYDWQCCNSLVGIVADWSWVNNEDRCCGSYDYDYHHDDFNWFTTIRGRAGMTVCNALVYVTLGGAVVGHDYKGSNIYGNWSRSFTRWGWAGGVGTEFLLGCNWSLAAEVLFLNFNCHNHQFTVNSTTYNLGISDNAFVGRIQLNYRFGDLCCF